MGGNRSNAGRVKCAPPQLGPRPSLRQRRHKPAGEQQMVRECEVAIIIIIR